jgi:hypothetical protein
MILVKDGKREPGHMDMQKLDEFCNMLPEVNQFYFDYLRDFDESFLDNTTIWNSNESSFRNKNYFSSSNSSMYS